MCLEACLAVNMAADTLLLAAVSRALGLFNLRRVLAAGALCAVYAALAAARPVPLSSIPVQGLLLVVVSVLISGPYAFGRYGAAAVALCVGAVCGGSCAVLCSLSGPWAALAGAGLGALALLSLLTLRPPSSSAYEVEVILAVGLCTARFPALVDTGNRLREPVSGLPVLIAEAGLLKGLQPGSGFRTLRYGAVGGGGCMPCFKPSAVWIRRGPVRRRAPDIWVAVAPQPLPGLFRALAPSTFSQYI